MYYGVHIEFISLPPSSVFGDYAVLFGLVSNILMRTRDHSDFERRVTESETDDNQPSEEDLQTQFMCCHADVFHKLCDLYPVTRNRVMDIALLKRDIYLHFRDVANDLRKG